MVNVVNDFPDYQFVVTAVSHLPIKMYEDIIGDLPVKIVTGKTYEVLSVSEAALVTSGTATLETALFNVPQVVCYKTSAFTYFLADIFVSIRFISLVNLIMDREIVKELVQKQLNKITLNSELSFILKSGWKREQMKKDYSTLHTIMGGKGASLRIATDIIHSLNKLTDSAC